MSYQHVRCISLKSNTWRLETTVHFCCILFELLGFSIVVVFATEIHN